MRRLTKFRYSVRSRQLITHSTLPTIDCHYLISRHKHTQNQLESVFQQAQQALTQQKPLLSSVHAFKYEIYDSPTLKINFEEGLRHVTQSQSLYNCKPELFFHMLSNLCQTPPKFSSSSIVEIPFLNLLWCLLDNQFGQMFFSNPLVNQCLQLIVRDYHIYLNSKLSLQNSTVNLAHLKQSNDVGNHHTQDLGQASGREAKVIRSWIDWYSRRPIEERPVDPRQHTVIHSAESYPFNFSILQTQNPTKHQIQSTMFTVSELFQTNQEEVRSIIDKHFVDGTYYQSYFDPNSYHIWNSPVAGTIAHTYRLNPKYHIEQHHHLHLTNFRELMARKAVTRQVVIIELDSHPKRYVGVVAIGSAVSSCVCKVIRGQKVEKGEQLGYFEFGSYSLVVVFDRDLQLTYNNQIYEEGSEIAISKKQRINSQLASFK